MGIKLITMEKVYPATKGLYVNIPFNRPVHKITNETDKTATHTMFYDAHRYGENVRRNRKTGSLLTIYLPIPQIMLEKLKQLQSITKSIRQNYPPHYFDL